MKKKHAGSSKSMERDVAYQLWCSAPEAGVKYSTYIGDDDSTTLADINSKFHVTLKNIQILFVQRGHSKHGYSTSMIILTLQTVMF